MYCHVQHWKDTLLHPTLKCALAIYIFTRHVHGGTCRCLKHMLTHSRLQCAWWRWEWEYACCTSSHARECQICLRNPGIVECMFSFRKAAHHNETYKHDMQKVNCILFAISATFRKPVRHSHGKIRTIHQYLCLIFCHLSPRNSVIRIHRHSILANPQGILHVNNALIGSINTCSIQNMFVKTFRWLKGAKDMLLKYSDTSDIDDEKVTVVSWFLAASQRSKYSCNYDNDLPRFKCQSKMGFLVAERSQNN